ncbi:phosphatase PAP2 family protein [Paracoccus sp. Z118]|uniref:phosphatase PAP2 family protein n=1 Tax=Paracoccus sp. Z118 TaxID=2851017 RepID=UPI0020B71F81|nr:phosphatase PAP2 family protein [Paracoccus sp. Z118]
MTRAAPGARMLAAALAAGLIASSPIGADPLEDFGTVMKYGLPLVAAACAVDQDRFGDFALRGGLQVGLVLGLKKTVGAPLGIRPRGMGEGFPSGHAASAAFGAADLASKCVDGNAGAQAGLIAAALLASFSRVDAGEHTPAQAAAGTAIGLILGASEIGLSFNARF